MQNFKVLPMNKTKEIFYLLPGIIFLFIGVMLCVRPDLKFPGAEARLSKQKNKLNRLCESIDKLNHETQALIVEVQAIPDIYKGAISLTTDGSIVLREFLDNAAAKSQILIRSIGDIQKRIVLEDSLVLYEVNFTAECTLEKFISLIHEIENNNPKLYWRTLTLRPNISKNNEILMLSGNITLISLEAQDEQ